MTPELSEFSFGFALTAELIHYYQIALMGAPRFPTQNEEGRQGGYDVELPRRGLPLFLQFKRSDCLIRNNAAEASQLGVPYYRMYLMSRRHSDQHQLLLGLEHRGNEVYYAAPRFHLMTELNDAYVTNTVAQRTSFILPSWVGPLNDDDHHYIAIEASNRIQLFCSENRRPIGTMKSEEVIQHRIREAARQRARDIDEQFMFELGDELVARYVEAKPRDRDRERIKTAQLRAARSPYEYAREVANTLYGCELLIALAENEPPARQRR